MGKIKSKYKYVKLHNSNNKARVDTEDFNRVSKYKWHEWNHNGHVYCIAYGKRTLYMHRLIMGVVEAGKQIYVDHRDDNGLHNNKANLRVCNNAENQWNTKKRGGTSKYKGVNWSKSKNRWIARIRIGNGKRKNLGEFKSEDEAGLAYNKACLEYHGKFAVLNDINTSD